MHHCSAKYTKSSSLLYSQSVTHRYWSVSHILATPTTHVYQSLCDRHAYNMATVIQTLAFLNVTSCLRLSRHSVTHAYHHNYTMLHTHNTIAKLCYTQTHKRHHSYVMLHAHYHRYVMFLQHLNQIPVQWRCLPSKQRFSNKCCTTQRFSSKRNSQSTTCNNATRHNTL